MNQLFYIFVVLIAFNMTTKENINVPGAIAILSIHGETDKPFAEGTLYFIKMKTKYPLIPGQRFTRLVVIETLTKLNTKGTECLFARLKCDCGKIVVASNYSLYKGGTKSCGCWMRDRVTKHGMFGTRLYGVWVDMNVRTTREANLDYKNYGGRGISVCEEWKKFIPFMEWALSHRYADNLTIDRINTNGNYEPANCRFIPLINNIWNQRKKETWGIYEYKGKKQSCFTVHIMRRGITYIIPTFRTIEEAIRARDEFISNYNIKENENSC